jgi:exodeoxyribonuclease VII small subunit
MATGTSMIKDFEKSMGELESIVSSLESGDLALEESLKLFEKGINISNRCQKALNEAEQKVKILNEKGLEEFEANDPND